jgi:hypothetical protein
MLVTGRSIFGKQVTRCPVKPDPEFPVKPRNVARFEFSRRGSNRIIPEDRDPSLLESDLTKFVTGNLCNYVIPVLTFVADGIPQSCMFASGALPYHHSENAL